jgi:hypothetical protein
MGFWVTEKLKVGGAPRADNKGAAASAQTTISEKDGCAGGALRSQLRGSCARHTVARWCLEKLNVESSTPDKQLVFLVPLPGTMEIVCRMT